MITELPWTGHTDQLIPGNINHRIVLLGGYAASALALGRLAEALNEQTGAEVLLLSLPGHAHGGKLTIRARQMCRRTAELLQAYVGPGQKVILGGYSYGGIVAAWIARKFPELVSGLLLLSPVIQYRNTSDTIASIAMLSAQFSAKAAALLLPVLAYRKRKLATLGAGALIAAVFLFGKQGKGRDTGTPYEFEDGKVVRIPHHLIISKSSAASLVGTQMVVRRTTYNCPVHLIYGDKDDNVTQEAIEEFARRQRKVSSRCMIGCGHRVMAGIYESACIDSAVSFCSSIWSI